MLQRNADAARHKAHAAHAAMVGLHSLCCGLPALAMLASAFSGATSGFAVFASYFSGFHQILHAHEVWLLIVSASLVTVGGVLEVTARRLGSAPKTFPIMFAVSVGCFVLNATIIAMHRVI
jgi:hypothetical protein